MNSSKNIGPLSKDSRITIPRLDYVGLPLAHAFSKVHPGVGSHINSQRIAEVNKGVTAVMMN
jgi:UDP-N-acetyl-D-mannosaminuronate dehydrogenase